MWVFVFPCGSMLSSKKSQVRVQRTRRVTSGSIGPWYTSACCKSPKETPCTLSHLGSALVMWWKTHFDQKWWEWGHGICIKMGSNWKNQEGHFASYRLGGRPPHLQKRISVGLLPTWGSRIAKNVQVKFLFNANNISTCIFVLTAHSAHNNECRAGLQCETLATGNQIQSLICSMHGCD